MTRVSLVKTMDRRRGVADAIRLLGLEPLRGKRVFLKANFNSADPTPGSTHNDTLRALIHELHRQGVTQITIGDRSGMGSTKEVMRQKDIFKIADELHVEVIPFDEMGQDGWVKIPLPGSHWRDGIYFARPALDADAIVQTCCLKTHRFGGHFTISLKNAVGMVAKTVPGQPHDYMQELHSSPHQRLMIAEINVAYQPALIVLDAVEAFVDGGPNTGDEVTPGTFLAGTDRVAIDAVGVAILRHFGTTPKVTRGSVFQQEQIARAVELGLGVKSPDQIELVTEDGEAKAFGEKLREIMLAI